MSTPRSKLRRDALRKNGNENRDSIQLGFEYLGDWVKMEAASSVEIRVPDSTLVSMTLSLDNPKTLPRIQKCSPVWKLFRRCWICELTAYVASVFVIISIFGSSSIAQDSPLKQGSDSEELSTTETLTQDQARLAEKYELLEDKLFSLYEFEQDNDPARSELLQRAFIQSQEMMTTARMKTIVENLNKARLRDAERDQGLVLAELEQLLGLLQSEDRSKRVRDEIQRHQAYLNEVERVLRIQKGIRGQLEGGVNIRRLARSQEKTAERTGRLAKEIEANEGSNSDQSVNPLSGDPDDAPIVEPSQDNGSDQQSPNGSGQPSPEPSRPENTPSESGDQSEDANPIRQRIQAAQQRMQEAKKELENTQRNESVEEMNLAERELARAKEELEDILRQLREEEVERTLAMMEERFRQMLEGQVRIYEATQKFSKATPNRGGNSLAIQTGKLSNQQNEIATQAARALMLLREDGSSIAFPVTVDEMHDDMLQVASRLAASKVGQITVQIEEDIIDTLEYLIQALVQTQKDMAKLKTADANSDGAAPGDQPLIDKLSEIKMLRGLQVRILSRHERYSRLLIDPDDPIGVSEKPSLQAALERLALRQSQLTDITRDIVNEMNQ